MTLNLDKTYLLRNGKRVYLYGWWHGDGREDDRAFGYGEDGLTERFNRDGTHWSYFFGGPSFNDPRLDIVGEAMDIGDLREEYFAYRQHGEDQRAELERTKDLPNGYELYRKWNRANRPPGPLRPGLYEKDYDPVSNPA